MFMESEICLERTQFIDQLGVIYLLMVDSGKRNLVENKKQNKESGSDQPGGGSRFNLTCVLIPDMEWHSWCSYNTFNQALTGDPSTGWRGMDGASRVSALPFTSQVFGVWG